MNIVMFYHSLLSDWNHGNAHFLRGIVSELLARGHQVQVFEPVDGWSYQNLIRDHGVQAIDAFTKTYEGLQSAFYREEDLDLDRALDGVDLVIAHEWNSHGLIHRLNQHRQGASYHLLFHDTHHRSVTDPAAMAAYDLSNFDGVLAFGNVIRDRYLAQQWARRAWTWHEAADTRLFKPSSPPAYQSGDLVWVGNWGDNERADELKRFLIEPVQSLQLASVVHGVRYPESALWALANAGIRYGGWVPNYRVPEIFSRFHLTVHIPRQPYVQALPGIPTIRVFEALACAMPLVSSPWCDSEGLFHPGQDFLVASNSDMMKQHLRTLLHEPEQARAMARHGWQTIQDRHTCSHRVDELLLIAEELGLPASAPVADSSLPVFT